MRLHAKGGCMHLIRVIGRLAPVRLLTALGPSLVVLPLVASLALALGAAVGARGVLADVCVGEGRVGPAVSGGADARER